jgi:hypothetical protein
MVHGLWFMVYGSWLKVQGSRLTMKQKIEDAKKK